MTPHETINAHSVPHELTAKFLSPKLNPWANFRLSYAQVWMFKAYTRPPGPATPCRLRADKAWLKPWALVSPSFIPLSSHPDSGLLRDVRWFATFCLMPSQLRGWAYVVFTWLTWIVAQPYQLGQWFFAWDFKSKELLFTLAHYASFRWSMAAKKSQHAEKC